MTLKRPVRQAISSGTTVYATVESYALGKATVRIHGGNRLTNLSTIGGVVSVGDIVVVDYSTGVIPIVRPMFTEAEAEEELDTTSVVLPEAASLVPLEEELPEDPPTYSSARPDIGCLVHHEMGYLVESIWFGFQTVYPNSPTFMYFASNEVGYPEYWDAHYAAEWTSPGMVDLSSLLGSTHVTIPVSGKYIIIVFWNDFISTLVDPLDGYYRVRIFKNYTDVLGTMTGGSLLGDDGEPGINLTRLCALEQGDQISLELFHTYNINDYLMDNWGHYDNITRGMVVQLLPFTVQE